MTEPFLTGQPVRVMHVAHECLRADLGRIEIVSHVQGACVWCRPAVVKADGTIALHPHLHFWITRRVCDVEAVTCA